MPASTQLHLPAGDHGLTAAGASLELRQEASDLQ
jgi:hypothetical protein